MSATKYFTRRTLRMYAEDCGWSVIRDEGRTMVVYRWVNGARREVCMTFDASDRLHATSVWNNVRLSIDQEPGNRIRTEMLLMGRGA